MKYNVLVRHEDSQRQTTPARLWQRDGLDHRGQQVKIVKKGNVIALLSPPPSSPKPKKFKLPDFEARRKRIFGDRVLPGNIVAEERESYEW